MSPTYDFTGQVALITGAGSGLGLATAQAFAAAGAAIALVDRNADQIEETTATLSAAGHRAIGIVCDVSDAEQAKTAVERTVAEFGRLDMAYNNAGILGPCARCRRKPRKVSTRPRLSTCAVCGLS